jgi:phosphate starvation-inducible protein PhoH and related proteins
MDEGKPKGKRVTRYKNAGEEAKVRTVNLVAMNDSQQRYISALNSHSQIIVTGFSGTGKTFIAASHAANLYANRRIDRIIITRPNIAVGKDLGYLPGTLEEKYTPWIMPVLDVLEQQLGKSVVETGMKSGNIQMVPLSVMRGRSFNRAFIIVDEAQNLTIHEMKMLLTRVGKECTIVINGDIKQSDINQQSGLSKILHLAKKYNMNIPTIEFGVDDIVRSDICKQWIIAFEEEKL